MCRDRLPASWPDLGGLGRKRGQDLGEIWLGGLPYGPPGAGMELGAFLLVLGFIFGPCWGILGHRGGRFGAIFGFSGFLAGVPWPRIIAPTYRLSDRPTDRPTVGPSDRSSDRRTVRPTDRPTVRPGGPWGPFGALLIWGPRAPGGCDSGRLVRGPNRTQ